VPRRFLAFSTSPAPGRHARRQSGPHLGPRSGRGQNPNSGRDLRGAPTLGGRIPKAAARRPIRAGARAFRGRELATQLPDLGMELAGVHRHLNAMVLGFRKLQPELGDLDRQLEDGWIRIGNGELHRQMAGDVPAREAGIRPQLLTESYRGRSEAPEFGNPLERWRHILWTATRRGGDVTQVAPAIHCAIGRIVSGASRGDQADRAIARTRGSHATNRITIHVPPQALGRPKPGLRLPEVKRH